MLFLKCYYLVRKTPHLLHLNLIAKFLSANTKKFIYYYYSFNEEATNAMSFAYAT